MERLSSLSAFVAVSMEKQIQESYLPPVAVVGTVALDILHFWNEVRTTQRVRIEIGGVCKHVACLLGNLNVATYFITTRFTGELGTSLGDLLQLNQVTWLPLVTEAPFALFEAHLDAQANVFDETFIADESLDALTPSALQAHAALAGSKIIVSCTNLSTDALDCLADMADTRKARFWLLSSSALDTPKIAQLERPLDLLAMNLDELHLLCGDSFDTLAEISAAALRTKPMANKVLVTLGSRGALLCQRGADHALFQPVKPIANRSPIGGGDVLFAGLLAAKMRGQEWDEAFAFGSACARAYLLRDRNSPTLYANLVLSASDRLPPLERIVLDNVT